MMYILALFGALSMVSGEEDREALARNQRPECKRAHPPLYCLYAYRSVQDEGEGYGFAPSEEDRTALARNQRPECKRAHPPLYCLYAYRSVQDEGEGYDFALSEEDRE